MNEITIKARQFKDDVRAYLKWAVSVENDGMLARERQPFSSIVNLRSNGLSVRKMDTCWAIEYGDKSLGATVALLPRKFSNKTGRELVPSISF